MNKVLIPSDKLNATDDELYQDDLFQILNPDVKIPQQYCKHYYKTVEPDIEAWRSPNIKCKNCGKNIEPRAYHDPLTPPKDPSRP